METPSFFLYFSQQIFVEILHLFLEDLTCLYKYIRFPLILIIIHKQYIPISCESIAVCYIFFSGLYNIVLNADCIMQQIKFLRDFFVSFLCSKDFFCKNKKDRPKTVLNWCKVLYYLIQLLKFVLLRFFFLTQWHGRFFFS